MKHLLCLEYSTVAIQNKAIEDFLYGLNSGKLQQPDLRRLSSVYFNSGQLYLQLNEASQAADRAASAIRLNEGADGPVW